MCPRIFLIVFVHAGLVSAAITVQSHEFAGVPTYPSPLSFPAFDKHCGPRPPVIFTTGVISSGRRERTDPDCRTVGNATATMEAMAAMTSGDASGVDVSAGVSVTTLLDVQGL